MARPKISPTVLADKGRPLVLLDGTKVHVCYSFAALMLVEEHFGSVQNAVKILADPEGSTYTNTVRMLACGLAHEIEPGGNGNMLSDVDVLAEYLDPAEFSDCVAVIGDALAAAFPAPTPDPTVGETTTTPISPGASGTTSPSSTTDSASKSSGA